MEIDRYLKRIRYEGPREPTTDTLRQLHRAHMLAVPFENLDIPLGNPIVLSLPLFYDKIVLNGRGGFCYELNGLFGWLLEKIGFQVVMLSACVFDGNQSGAEFDHLVLVIQMEDDILVDVGFGDSFLAPLRLQTKEENIQHNTSYRLTGSNSRRILQRRSGSDWKSQYVFSSTPRRLDQFTARCQHHQTSSSSIFTKKTICSLATQDGRITLSNNRLITTTTEHNVEQVVKTESEYRLLLETYFDIYLSNKARVDRLMAPATP